MKQTIEVSSEPWIGQFDERQQGLIHSCRQYVTDGAPGLPGHQLMLIVAKMAALLDAAGGTFSFGVETEQEPD